jgi:hypothetical protein
MKSFGTIGPNPLFVKISVSAKIQRSFPLGRATLRPSSRDIALEAFSYCDKTGVTVGADGEATASGDAKPRGSTQATATTAPSRTKVRAAGLRHDTVIFSAAERATPAAPSCVLKMFDL